jgi:hypothetical protein
MSGADVKVCTTLPGVDGLFGLEPMRALSCASIDSAHKQIPTCDIHPIPPCNITKQIQVYIADYQSEADLVVYRASYESQVSKRGSIGQSEEQDRLVVDLNSLTPQSIHVVSHRPTATMACKFIYTDASNTNARVYGSIDRSTTQPFGTHIHPPTHSWYFTSYQSSADKKIYFVDYKSQADLVIYFTTYQSGAGWKSSSKKWLME